MASKASTKRTDTNLLRMELLSEFNRLSDIIDHRTQDAEKNRTLLEESYENIQKRITTIREEVMNELQRLEEATMKIAEKLREKVNGQINKYRMDLEEMNKRYVVMQVAVFCVFSLWCHCQVCDCNISLSYLFLNKKIFKMNFIFHMSMKI